jgi:hypothetical protein
VQSSLHCFISALGFGKNALFSVGTGFADREPSVTIFVV